MIEMMVVIAIIAILTATVVGNYGSFRSATVATNMAYEVASTLRQAQLYGLGVRLPGDGAGQTDTYGVEFTPASPSYAIFRETDTGDGDGRCDTGGCDGRCDGGTSCDCTDAASECVEQVRMLQQVQVEALCATTDASLDSAELLAAGSACSQTALSITFTRPNPEALIQAGGEDDWNLAGILVRGGGHCRLVRMYSNGQISVEGISAADADGTMFEDECDGA
jgi:hypothetical protein